MVDADHHHHDDEEELSSSSPKMKKEKKKKEKKRKRKERETEEEEVNGGNPSAEMMMKDPENVEKDEKKKKKKKKKEKHQEVHNNNTTSDDDGDGGTSTDMVKTTGNEKEDKKVARKLAREAKLKQQAEWMSKVPKVDEDGIAYTKLQTRRMLKRVKKGLAPIPTKAEEEAMRRNEAQLRREEEAELAGMIFKRDDDDDDDDNDDKEKDENEEEDVENDDDDKEKEDDDEDGAGEKEDEGMEESEDTPTSPAAPVRETPAKKKAKRSKPVPEDYVCSACKNKHTPVHWIYDCPDKVTMKGTNKKKKKLRGLHEPDANKVFVSGLPFDVKPKDILSLFQPCGKIASHKLVTFKDTGRCNGQAYVTFETQEAATKALKISGTSIGNISEDSSKKKKKSSDSSPKRKELKLKVSKVLNRRFTKGTTVK